MKKLQFLSVFLLPVIALLLLEFSIHPTIPAGKQCLNAPRLVILSQKNADPGRSNGSIELKAVPEHQNLHYSINGIDFQKSGRFTGMQAGTYSIIAKTTEGCSSMIELVLDDDELRANGRDGAKHRLGVAKRNCICRAARVLSGS